MLNIKNNVLTLWNSKASGVDVHIEEGEQSKEGKFVMLFKIWNKKQQQQHEKNK